MEMAKGQMHCCKKQWKFLVVVALVGVVHIEGAPLNNEVDSESVDGKSGGTGPSTTVR